MMPSARLFLLPFLLLLSIDIFLTGCGGSSQSTAGSAPTQTGTTVSITSISPTSIPAGGSDLKLTVLGTGFQSSSVVQVNGTSISTQFVSSTQLIAVVPAADLTTGAALSISVLTGTRSTAGSGSPVTLEVDNPKPVVSSLSPSVVAVASTPPVVSVTGSGFLATTAMQVNGNARKTAYISETQISVQLNNTDNATPGNLALTAVNPSPGGGTSSPATVTITGATPVLVSVNPSEFFVGAGDSQIQVTGIGLAAGESIQWNGVSLQTAVSSDTAAGLSLMATVPGNLLSAPGIANVSVSSPPANPQVSNSVQVQISRLPQPTITSLSTTMLPTSIAGELQLYGTGLTTISVVHFRGLDLPVSNASSTSVSVEIPASALLLPGVDPLTISNENLTSSPVSITTYVAIVNNSMVYDPANGLFYLSVPSAAGSPYGNSIVSIDPATGALGKPITVGSEPNRMAITGDGRYLWVSLDGAAAVRRVDLSTGTADPQFSVATNGLDSVVVSALAALPGALDSVVVSTYQLTDPLGGVSIAIYDSGVPRPTSISGPDPIAWTLLVDPSRNEIYGPGGADNSAYRTYSYSDTGVSLKSSTFSELTYAQNFADEAQIVAGQLYTDYGQVVDPESGKLLGTFDPFGKGYVQGSIAIDTGLEKIFFLYDGVNNVYDLQPYKLSDLEPTSDPPIPISLPQFRAEYQWAGPTGNRLTRWGANGLALRSTGGFVSLRSSTVRDLSSTSADLEVSIATAGALITGTDTTYAATITNRGPSAASDITVTALLPSTGVLVSAASPAGTCSGTAAALCHVGTLAANASTTVVLQVLQTTAGTGSLAMSVTASEPDPVGSNNAATSTLQISGDAYNLIPGISSISPNTIPSGSGDTAITVTGTGFSNASAVLLNGNAIPTTYTSATQLSATVPAASLASLDWAAISISNPAPGGGTSSAMPLSVYSILNLGANHIVYDPYSRKIMASIGPGTSAVPANSLVAITPENGAIGSPSSFGSTPTTVALTSDGQILYTLLPSIGSVARYNMLTGQADFTVGNLQAAGYNVGLRDIAVQPESENTIALDQGEYPGITLYDFDPTTKTATPRGATTGIYTGTCLAFPDPNSLFAIDLYGSPNGLERYTVSTSGLLNGSYPYHTFTSASYLGCYKLDSGLLFSTSGGVLQTAVPQIQVGTFEGMVSWDTYGMPVRQVAPDVSLGRVFFMNNDTEPVSGTTNAITGYDLNTFLPAAVMPIDFATAGGNTDPSADTNAVDLVRWGQDGLAALDTSGHLYLLRGAAIVPQLLNTNSAANLTNSSISSIVHGAGNTNLTLTGSNFIPGIVVTWNGNYRFTRIIDPTHLSVAIPATDLVQPGVATLVAVNPGAGSSSSLTINVQ